MPHQFDIERIRKRREVIATELERLRREGNQDDPDLPEFIKTGEVLIEVLDAAIWGFENDDERADSILGDWWPSSTKWLAGAKAAPTR